MILPPVAGITADSRLGSLIPRGAPLRMVDRGAKVTPNPGNLPPEMWKWAHGNVYGFVSFSDHRSTHNGWACIWTDLLNREGLLDAMFARRTYAAPDEIRRVDVIRDGMHIWTKEPNARSMKATFRDMNVKPGKAYYYVRVFQRDGEKPDGDPEIAWSSPMFVTYK